MRQAVGGYGQAWRSLLEAFGCTVHAGLPRPVRRTGGYSYDGPEAELAGLEPLSTSAQSLSSQVFGYCPDEANRTGLRRFRHARQASGD